MHLEIIDGISNDKVRRACYAYLYEKMEAFEGDKMETWKYKKLV